MTIDSTTKTSLKVAAIISYLESSGSDEDKLLAIYFLLGEKLKIPKFKRSDLKQLFVLITDTLMSFTPKIEAMLVTVRKPWRYLLGGEELSRGTLSVVSYRQS